MRSLGALLLGAGRSLRRHPANTALAVLTLALGLGASLVILSLAQAALVAPVRFPQAHRLVDILATRADGPASRFGIYPADALAWSRHGGAFEEVGIYSPLGEKDLTGHGEPVRLTTHAVTAGYFATLGVPILHGRDFLPAEEVAGRDRVVLLGAAVFERLFDGDPAIVGRTLSLSGEPFTVVGVVPGGYGFRGGVPDLWLPLAFGPDRPADRGSAYLGMVGRLAPGVSLGQARARLLAVAQAHAEATATPGPAVLPSLEPLTEVMLRGLRRTVLGLIAAVGCLFLVASVNAAGLGLARSLARGREMAVRASLGAGARRLAGEALAESLLLALLAAGLAAILASLALEALPPLGGRVVYRSVEVGLTSWVVAGAAGLALVSGLLAGLPSAALAWQSGRRPDLARRARPSDAGTPRNRFWSGILVAGEIAATTVLLAGAGLLVASLLRLQAADSGLSPGEVLAFELAPPKARYPSAESLGRLYDALLADLDALPGSEATALSSGLPGGGWSLGVHREDQADEESVASRHLLVSPRYFRTAGIPLLLGRSLADAERAEEDGGRQLEAVISRELARKLRPGAGSADDGEDLLGARVWVAGKLHRVVGVAGDVHADPVSPPRPAAYLPLHRHLTLRDPVGLRQVTVLVRSRTGLPPPAGAIRDVVRALDPELPVSRLGRLEARLDEALFRPRLELTFVASFAVLALSLSALGIYGLLRAAVERRRRELGVRLALGASPGSLLGRVLGQGLALCGLGLAGGLGATALLAPALARLLEVPRIWDLRVFAAVTALVLAAAAAAALIPARRAAAVEPGEVLASE